MVKHKHDNWKVSIFFGLFMILFQFAGACIGCAACLGAMVNTPQDDKKLPDPGSHYITQLCPRMGCNDGGDLFLRVFLVEAMMTGFFVGLVLQVAKVNGAVETPLNTMMIGLSLYAAIQISAGISGGAINPAVGVIQTVFQSLFNQYAYPNAPPVGMAYAPIYAGACCCGGLMAGFVHKLIIEIAYARKERAQQNE